MTQYKNHIRIVVAALFFSCFVVVANFLPLFDQNGLNDFFHQIQSSNHMGILFILITIVLTVFFVPISWLVAIGAVFFGLTRGFLYSLTAATIAAIISFSIIRIISGHHIHFLHLFMNKQFEKKNMDEKVEVISKQVENHGLKYMFFLRNVPLLPFVMLNYLSGISSVNFKDYALGSFLGMVPGLFISTFFFTRAINVVNSPLEALFALLIKIGYFICILMWEKNTRDI